VLYAIAERLVAVVAPTRPQELVLRTGGATGSA